MVRVFAVFLNEIGKVKLVQHQKLVVFKRTHRGRGRNCALFVGPFRRLQLQLVMLHTVISTNFSNGCQFINNDITNSSNISNSNSNDHSSIINSNDSNYHKTLEYLLCNSTFIDGPLLLARRNLHIFLHAFVHPE